MAEVSDIKMTELKSVVEALALIDEGLGGLAERQLVSTSEVTDLLLDVRSLLSEPTDSASPVGPIAAQGGPAQPQ